MKDHHKKIEQYFANELSEQDRQELEQQLSSDTELAQAFQLEQDLMAGIEAVGNDKLREQLGQIHREEIENRQPSKVRSLRRSYLWAVAAVLVIGLLGLVWWLMAPSAISAAGLYAEYAEYSFDFTEMGTAEDDLFQAERLLNQGEYKEALPFLEKYLAQKPEDNRAVLALGVAKLESEADATGAIQLFRQVETKGGILQNEAQWHMGLAYLKQGNLEESQKVLAQIPANSARYTQAVSLQKAIERLK